MNKIIVKIQREISIKRSTTCRADFSKAMEKRELLEQLEEQKLEKEKAGASILEDDINEDLSMDGKDDEE